MFGKHLLRTFRLDLRVYQRTIPNDFRLQKERIPLMPDAPGTVNPTTVGHETFVKKEEPILATFLFGRRKVQVPMGQKWLIYKNGELVDQLNPGRHVWWGWFSEWKVQKVNTRIELMEQRVEGRVKGPDVPQNPEDRGSNISLACDVKATLRLSIKIKDVETYMQRTDPIITFRSALSNLVVEFIGQLKYDESENGNWATTLREQIRNALLGSRENAEQRFGLHIDDIYVVAVEPNSTRDREVLAMYRLVEQNKRRLTEVIDKRKSDAVDAQSFADQGSILNIAPSILKLQDSPIGKALIEQDSRLRELIIATGINPGINIQPLQEYPNQISGPQSAPNVYLNPAPSNLAQIGPASNAFPQQAGPVSGPMPYGSEVTGSLSTTGNLGRQNPPPSFPGAQQPMPSFPGAQQSVPSFSGASQAPVPFPESSDTFAIDEIRQNLELSALEKAGFTSAGRGQIATTTNEWTLMVYKRRPNGILTIAFTCPAGYPNNAPRVQVKTATGGYSDMQPNSLQGWQAHRLLADVAQEILETTL
jgi:hypothetical protein